MSLSQFKIAHKLITGAGAIEQLAAELARLGAFAGEPSADQPAIGAAAGPGGDRAGVFPAERITLCGDADDRPAADD